MRARFASVLARTIRAGVAAARGERSEALRILDGARGDLWYQQSVTSPFFSRAYERYLHAELLNAEGAGDEALSWYGTLGESSPYELIYLAPAHLRQGELLEQRGDLTRASHHFTRCARLWSRCDDMLADVRDRASARLRAVRRH